MNKNLINPSIENFRNVLISGIENVISAYSMYHEETEKRENDYPDSFEDFYHDWAQCNWELLVERIICSQNERLVPYGDGSDYNSTVYSHVFFPEYKETHEIICLPKSSSIDILTGVEINLEKFLFSGFVSLDDQWFSLKAPFDYLKFDERDVIGANNKLAVIPLNSITFDVKKL